MKIHFSSKQTALLGHDLFLIVVTALTAGCGLIYEYLLAHYAGRILGAVETVIYAIIGLMIVSMGAGSFAARLVRAPFTGFAWLEALIALLGAGMVLFLATVFSFAHLFPQIIAETFGLPEELAPQGNFFADLLALVRLAPYLMSIIMGFMIGMEIPLIARVRELLHEQHLIHNTGAIYGADYIGAGIGAACWILAMLGMEITRAAAATALVNVLAGLLFLILYWRFIQGGKWLLMILFLVLTLTLVVMHHGQSWSERLEDTLYQDQVIHRTNTPYQRLTLTRRAGSPQRQPVYRFYIDGRLQFSSNDEHIYHAMLVEPAMAAAARQKQILIIGGGDGLALRNVLRWNPDSVTLLELDPEVVALFSHPVQVAGRPINAPFLQLNGGSFADPRVRIRYGDAFVTVDALLADKQAFDVILVDLPDPGHPDLDKLYSAYFYAKLKNLLTHDGTLAVQSTSPYHAREAFLCVGVTLRHAGFKHVEPYHQNVPSFGEWGWTLATQQELPASQRLRNLDPASLRDPWLTREIMVGAFAFGQGFFSGLENIQVNRLGSQHMYRYHHEAWVREQGRYQQPTASTAPQ
ncbi:MAG: polyamine aminopropyltransferase [Magnetococcus sp. DMHC-1]